MDTAIETPVETPKPKRKRVRVQQYGSRISVSIRPASSNWFEVLLTRDEAAELISNLVSMLV